MPGVRGGGGAAETHAVLERHCPFLLLMFFLKNSQDMGTTKKMLFSCAFRAVSSSSDQGGELAN